MNKLDADAHRKVRHIMDIMAAEWPGNLSKFCHIIEPNLRWQDGEDNIVVLDGFKNNLGSKLFTPPEAQIDAYNWLKLYLINEVLLDRLDIDK